MAHIHAYFIVCPVCSPLRPWIGAYTMSDKRSWQKALGEALAGCNDHYLGHKENGDAGTIRPIVKLGLLDGSNNEMVSVFDNSGVLVVDSFASDN